MRPRLPVFALVAALAALARRDAAGEESAAAPFRSDGLERRTSGIVLFKSRWDPGVLEVRDDLVRWTDLTNPGKNLVLSVRRLLSHELVCPGKADMACTEWRLVTKTETYVFRETPSRGGATLKRAFDALRGAYPDVPSSEKR